MLIWLTKRALWTDFGWVVAAAVVVVGLWARGTFQAQERRLLDRRFQMRPPLPAGDDIVLITIDNASLQFIGRWPWPRSIHAELLNRLTDAGARVVAFDVVFSEPGDAREDEALARAVTRSKRVVLPVFVPPTERRNAVTSRTVLYPIPSLERAAPALGHIGLAPDNDGRFRRLQLFVTTDPTRGATLPAFSLAAVCRYLGVRPPPPGKGTQRRVSLGKGRTLYTDGRGCFLCNYFGGSGAGEGGGGIHQVKYVEALYGNLPADTFRDKLVVVGATAGGIGEQFLSTPLPAGGALSGAQIHASAMETLLQNVSLRKPGRRVYGVVLFLISFLFALAMARLRKHDALYSLLAVAAFLYATWAFSQWQFRAKYLWIEYYPLAVLAVGSLAVQVLWRLGEALYLLFRRRTELNLITDVGARTTSDSDLAEDFHAAVQAALAVADTHVGALWVREENGDAFTLELVTGIAADSVKAKQFRAGEGTLGQATTGEEPVVFHGDRKADCRERCPWSAPYPSVALLPLRAQGRCLGVLAVGKPGSQTYDAEQVQALRALALQSGLGLDNARLVQRLQRTFIATLGALSKALEAKDPYTRGHSGRVTDYSLLIAERLGFSPEALETLRYAGEMHDVGKIGMPDVALNKPGKLTNEEYEAFKSHAQLTGDILEGLDWLREVRDIAMHHHERWDGRGYPDGLAGADIPLGARILAIADAYDAMTSDRSYRKGMPHAKAVRIIVGAAGTQLDPHLVEVFLHTPDAPWTEAARAVLREREAAAPEAVVSTGA